MYTVLYVDDEPQLLELGKIFLEQGGSIGVETVLSAKEGIQALRDHAIDCIISDYQMPEMDGLAFLKYLRSQNNHIPFILFTGRGREEVVIEAVNSGVDYYLQKGGDPRSQFVELEHKVMLAIEKRHTEEELNESRQRLTDIIDHLPDATFAIDMGGKVIAWNRAIEEMTEVKKEEIMGAGDHAYALPFYGTRRPILLDLVLRNDPGTEKKYPQITRKENKLISEIYIPLLYGGKGAYLWFIASPLYDTHGNITGAIESIRDITDRKTTETELRSAYEQITASEEELREQYDELKKSGNALRESKTLLEEIVHGSPIPQFVIDKKHRVISWNRALAEHSGVTAESVLGTTHAWKAFYNDERPVLADLLVDNDQEKIPAWYAGKFNRSKYVDGAFEATDFFPGMGTRGAWLYFTAAALRDSAGNIVGAVETLEDISDRKIAEEELRASYEQITASEEELREQYDMLKKSGDALRESEEKYRSILDNIQDVYYRSDTAGNLILASPTMVSLLGYDSVSDLIGKNIAQTFYYLPEERTILLAELSSRGAVTDYEVTLKRRDGTPVPVSTSSHRYYDENGKVLGVEGIFRDITERKEMEDTLRANEEKYRSLVDNLNVGVYRNTAEYPGQWLWANPAFVRIFGYDSLSECLERSVTDFYVNREDRKKFIGDLMANGFVRDYKVQLKRKDGTPVWVSINAQTRKSPDGAIVWIDGICDDITAFLEAEEKARKNQLDMTRAIDYLPDATFIIDRKGTVIAWNRAIEEMTGVRATDIIGRGEYEYAIPFYGNCRPILIDLIFAPEEELQLADYSEIKRSGEILSVETRNPILKGRPSVVRAIAAPIHDENGNIAGAIETITDITELKRAQENLKVSENRYRTIFENTGTATVLLEENTVISIANAEFERLSGLSREELEGKKSWTEFVVKEDLERMLAQHHLRREKHEAALRHYEFRFVTKTHGIRNIFLTIDVIPGTKQSVASLMDVTSLVQAQDAVKLANKKLNLLNSITRHDILNQLTSLFGFLALAEENIHDPVAITYLERQKKIAETIRIQIEFTRDYQDVGIHSPEWQQVTGTINKAVAALSLPEVTLSVETRDVEIFADMLLQKVFFTLLENAVRHGGTVTRIRFTAEETPEGLDIVCEDNGEGVPMEAKERIFRREHYQHTGLGLFLIREILGITGIAISENGEPGRGARFEIHVPKGAYRAWSHQKKPD
ncbi:MAG: PAS domain S-box protein [Methanoregula sp.]|nr:PAS domain S-box protein [Methanoregula sp.]